MKSFARHIARPLLTVSMLAAGGGAGGWLGQAIGPPAVADGIDIIVFILLGILAGCGILALLPIIGRLPAAWRNGRAGIMLPVLMKEMRSAMRGMRTPALMLASAGLAAIIGLIVLATGWTDYGSVSDTASAMATLGGNLVHLIFLLDVIIALLLAPALTAGAFSREREQGTLEMLLLTRMSSGQIAWGKLLAGLSVLGMILLCTLPVAGIGFMLGGVAGWQLLAAVGMLAAAAFGFGAIGLWCSARFRRTAVSITMAYILCVVSVVFTPFVTGFFTPGITADMSATWLLLFGVYAVSVPLVIFLLPSLSRHFSRKVRRTGIAVCALIFILGVTSLRLAASIPGSFSLASSDDWSEYIEYIDPILAFGILTDPSGYFDYEGIYAEFDEDWPIILTNFAIMLLIASLMLALTRWELRRARDGVGRQESRDAGRLIRVGSG